LQAARRDELFHGDVSMDTPNTAPIPLADSISLEKVAKISTYALPAVYLCGFVVLSLYEGGFGIADLSLVRVKALAAGLLFVFFIAFPSIVGMRAFQLLGLKKPLSTPVNVGGDSNLPYFYIIKLADLYILSFYISMMLQFLFVHHLKVWLMDTPTYQEPWHFSLLPISAGLITVGTFMLSVVQFGLTSKQFAAKPFRCALLGSLVSLLWAIWTFEMSDRLFFQLVGWCYLVGLASILAARAVEKGRGLKSADWEIRILLAFALLVPWFAASLYGNIKPAFGGGSPVSAKLYLMQDNAILGGRILDVLIVEETDHGYYVVNPTRTSKKAVFIPRSSVSTAEFGSSEK
jgi:hypothetical protein